jgi:transposase
MARQSYPSDISDDAWAFVAPDLTLMSEDAPQRLQSLREVCNGWRWLVRAGAPWRMLPPDLPPWAAVSHQTQRWLNAGVFAAMGHGLRVVLRLAEGREGPPSAAIFDRRTLQSTPESGPRAGYGGAKRQRGSKVHMAVDTLGHLLGLHVTAADAQDRAQVAQLAEQVQAVTGASVQVAFVDQGYTGDQPAAAAAAHGMQREVVKSPEAKQGFVLLPRRWVVERRVAGAARFRRLARDYERLPVTLAGFHVLAFVILLLKRFIEMMAPSA